MQVVEYRDSVWQQVIDLIIGIQQQELGVGITANEQPDLENIHSVYQKGNGNFWIAEEGGTVIGTIALIDIGNSEVALRKMFVHQSYRGKDKGVAAELMNTLLAWCGNKAIKNIYLGTIDTMKAAHRFYEKNGFHQLDKMELPAGFPLMAVDNIFYRLPVTQ
jgi:N-acetylglutamate synthase-like GNAT family acetyltransferase